jgi:hypothetical protein
LAPKVKDLEAKRLDFQPLAPKDEDPELRPFGIQLSMSKLGLENIMLLGFKRI